ncbi:hypothetical protein G9P44_001431 [Scheffersomyces stipitis]|nr:hypothetical protein G9P44_001431 [Scheffersomyces stipitis]
MADPPLGLGPRKSPSNPRGEQSRLSTRELSNRAAGDAGSTPIMTKSLIEAFDNENFSSSENVARDAESDDTDIDPTLDSVADKQVYGSQNAESSQQEWSQNLSDEENSSSTPTYAQMAAQFSKRTSSQPISKKSFALEFQRLEQFPEFLKLQFHSLRMEQTVGDTISCRIPDYSPQHSEAFAENIQSKVCDEVSLFADQHEDLEAQMQVSQEDYMIDNSPEEIAQLNKDDRDHLATLDHHLDLLCYCYSFEISDNGLIRFPIPLCTLDESAGTKLKRELINLVEDLEFQHPITKQPFKLTFRPPTSKKYILGSFKLPKLYSRGANSYMDYFLKGVGKRIASDAPTNKQVKRHNTQIYGNVIYHYLIELEGSIAPPSTIRKPVLEDMSFQIQSDCIHCTYCHSLDHTRRKCTVAQQCRLCGSRQHATSRCKVPTTPIHYQVTREEAQKFVRNPSITVNSTSGTPGSSGPSRSSNITVTKQPKSILKHTNPVTVDEDGFLPASEANRTTRNQSHNRHASSRPPSPTSSISRQRDESPNRDPPPPSPNTRKRASSTTTRSLSQDAHASKHTNTGRESTSYMSSTEVDSQAMLPSSSLFGSLSDNEPNRSPQ